MSMPDEDGTPVPSRLRKLVAQVLGINEAALTEDVHFVEDLGADSLIGLEVLVAMENEYGITFCESELRQMTSLRRIHELMLARNAQTRVDKAGGA